MAGGFNFLVDNYRTNQGPGELILPDAGLSLCGGTTAWQRGHGTMTVPRIPYLIRLDRELSALYCQMSGRLFEGMDKTPACHGELAVFFTVRPVQYIAGTLTNTGHCTRWIRQTWSLNPVFET